MIHSILSIPIQSLLKRIALNPYSIGIWWAHLDSNQGPKDSGLCDFRHSLDYAFTIAYALGGCRLVSTPSALLSQRSLARYCRMHSHALRFRRI